MDDYHIRAVEIWLAATHGTFGDTYHTEMLPSELASPLFCLELYLLGFGGLWAVACDKSLSICFLV